MNCAICRREDRGGVVYPTKDGGRLALCWVCDTTPQPALLPHLERLRRSALQPHHLELLNTLRGTQVATSE
jgi:hypothetical protein